MPILAEIWTIVAADDIRLGHDLSDLGRERARRIEIVDIALQDRELVAAEARHNVIVADRAAHPRRHLTQQRVADGMAERIVDVLEMIEIEIKHGERLGAAIGGGESSVQCAA